jgi:hypothetical protein
MWWSDSNLNYIYVVRFEFELFVFLLKNPLQGRFLIELPLQIHTAGAASDTAALTEVHYKGG